MGKLLIAFLLLISVNNGFAQNKPTSSITGWWVNTQYAYFKNQPQAEQVLYHISPWFIQIDSSGKCTVKLTYEQQSDAGYPINQKASYNGSEYHYRKGCDIWLYTVKDNDSLLVYSNGITPGAGIIFKRYNK
jgi:hypothetical protein